MGEAGGKGPRDGLDESRASGANARKHRIFHALLTTTGYRCDNSCVRNRPLVKREVEMQVMLPYRTDWRSVMTMLDYVKGKGADRASLEARLGSGESFRETLNTAEQLGLVDRDEGGEIRLTTSGQRIAYASNDGERRRELAAALCRYLPYRVPFERALHASSQVIDGPSVERTWQVDMRLGQPRNRVEEARTLFFRLADEAGLGTFRRGVRGQPTRLELSNEYPLIIGDLLDETAGETKEPEAAPAPEAQAGPPTVEPIKIQAPPVPSAAPGVRLEITVDMSDWDLEKIEAFLAMVGMRAGSSDDA
jgi:hypothetical protein